MLSMCCSLFQKSCPADDKNQKKLVSDVKAAIEKSGKEKDYKTFTEAEKAKMLDDVPSPVDGVSSKFLSPQAQRR